MEFKNLATVTQLEEVPEGASVLAATAEGEVVRVPSYNADWNAADGELGHIANRTHWKDEVVVNHLTNKTLTFTKNYGGEPYASLDGMPGIVEGREYTVVWGGTSYTCTAYMPSNSSIHVALGDSASKGDSDASSGTGEPFYITNEIDTDYWTFYRSSVGKVVVSVSCIEPTYHTIDVKYLPFVAASGEGEGSIVLGSLYNVASGEFAFASGGGTSATGGYSSAEGAATTASGDKSHAEGMNSVAEGSVSHAEGFYTKASGLYTHAEGWETLASSNYQHVQGKYNVEDTTKTYAHIVGNGTSSKRSNAHTIDWNGNAWFAGNVEGTALIVKSPNGTRYQITVDDSGTLNASAL